MSMKNELSLVCGDPCTQCSAAFTRFVFPFAYKYEENAQAEGSAALHYREIPPENFQEQQNYFTHETADVLYKQAKWLEMEKTSWEQSAWGQSIHLCVRGKSIAVAMLPPRLVLFNWKAEELLFKTGFLLLDLYFPESAHKENPPDLNDLLVINDYFRYFRQPWLEHKESYRRILEHVPISLEPGGTTIGSAEGHEDIYLERWLKLLKVPIRTTGNDCYALKTNEQEQPTYADNRAFVWSAAVLERGAESLKDAFRTNEWRAHKFGHWIKLLNVDSPDPETKCASKIHAQVIDFERKWAKERTYHRWEAGGTWYGFNYHSGVMLCAQPGETDVPVVRHFRRMYFDMILLLFYMRATLFRFSRELAGNAEKLDTPEGFEIFRRLRKVFAQFTLRYQFPLLSNQQQPIEMYALARQHFDIEDLYKEVKEEIDSSHQFMEMLEQHKFTEATHKLTAEQHKLATAANKLAVYGIPLATASLVGSLFGMNASEYPLLDWLRRLFEFDLPKSFWQAPSISLVVMCLIACSIGLAAHQLVKKCFENSKQKPGETND